MTIMQSHVNQDEVQNMAIFEDNRIYRTGDPALNIIGETDKLAQWRHRNYGPPWIKMGRFVAYTGGDLNAWLAAQRTDPKTQANIEVT